MDCAAICRRGAGFMARGSAFSKNFCKVCAQIGEACAKERQP
jgi:hypothetical protein